MRRQDYPSELNNTSISMSSNLHQMKRTPSCRSSPRAKAPALLAHETLKLRFPVKAPRTWSVYLL